VRGAGRETRDALWERGGHGPLRRQNLVQAPAAVEPEHALLVRRGNHLGTRGRVTLFIFSTIILSIVRDAACPISRGEGRGVST